jgi:hypothetical protein
MIFKGIERVLIWSGLLWIGYYWNPLKNTLEDTLWIELWGFILVFFICIMEEIKTLWEKIIKEGKWESLYLKQMQMNWYIKNTLKISFSLYPLLFLFWWMTGPWSFHPTEKMIIGLQPILLWIWIFFWIQVLSFWMVWNGRSLIGQSFPLEIWMVFPFAFYTFMYVAEPSLWFIHSDWNPKWKMIGVVFLIWTMISPKLFEKWFLIFPPVG